MVWVLILLISLAVGDPAHAEGDVPHDEFVQAIYASMEDSVRREYNSALMSTPRRATAKSDKVLQALKVLYYNKAALFAFCAADAEQARAPNAARVPAEHNIVLTTCVEKKFGALNDFTNKLNYAGVFFPERIIRCGEASRLPDHERLLPPYRFLELGEPRLFDFARYNQCLMTSN